MTTATRPLALIAALVSVGLTTAVAQALPNQRPSDAAAPAIPYATLWADTKGQTHISSCSVKGLKLVKYAPPAGPEWIGVPPGDIKGIAYEVSPVGFFGTWHRPPGPQWVVALSGKWAVETTDGHELTQGPGEVQFNADSDPMQTRRTGGSAIRHAP